MTKISRREFIAFSFVPILVGKAGAVAAASPHHADSMVSLAPETPALPPAPTEELLGAREECSDCRGLGIVVCPACDGTGMWNEASESAGIHQREAARAKGHCAWCYEWGEITCQACDGTGGML
jgi:hypothetical protein